jgi:type IV secretory pathway VirB10-like protein
MRRRSQRNLTNSGKKQRIFFVPAACAFGLLLCGCFGEKRPAARAMNVSLAHPVLPVDATNGTPDDPPQIPYAVVLLPSLGARRTAPARPRVAPPPPSESTATERATETLILPEMSPDQIAAAKAETQQSLDAAEGNLARTQGKSLDPAQKDLQSKTRNFMDTAREAMRKGDLPRARNFAKKAEVLSRELAASL